MVVMTMKIATSENKKDSSYSHTVCQASLTYITKLLMLPHIATSVNLYQK